MLRMIDIEKQADGIKMTLTPEGREELEEHRIEDEHMNLTWDAGTSYIFSELLEYNLANGWSFIQPEEIGALTSSPILSDSAVRDDYGNLIFVDSVYWFPDYAIRCELEELLEKGEVFFPLAKE